MRGRLGRFDRAPRRLGAAGLVVLTVCMGLLSCGDPTPSLAEATEVSTVKADSHATPKHTNRLVDSTSPYLLQHAHNPVDWYPWGEEALKAAQDQGKPIFLSIGYSACHWCHVMERESFESEEVAAIMNKHFINVKVDREERPDLDEVYMSAVQTMTGRGGWPMSVFLTPDRMPFYGGSYYPPEDRYGLPGFKTVLNSIIGAWSEDPERVRQTAQQLTDHLRQQNAQAAASAELPKASLLDGAARELQFSFDEAEGGFGPAPKFPPSAAIRLLLRRAAATGKDKPREMATHTLNKMMHGGLFDQLGGGFHRYSVDGFWLVPHFEKMLYDNALLVPAYLEAYALTGEEPFRQTAVDTLEYVLRDMRDKDGGFYSSEDADSEGQEGKFYVWTHKEIMGLLGAEEGELFCAFYGVLPKGNFESHEAYHKGTNILHVTESLEELARAHKSTPDTVAKRLAQSRARLLTERDTRVRPGRDEKVITAWNGLMITAFARASKALNEPRYAEAAEEAAQFLRTHMMKDGVLLRAYRNGVAHTHAFLEDYAFTVNAFLDVREATGKPEWLEAAQHLMKTCEERFWDPEGGAFFRAEAGREDLIVRTKPMYDGAEPSGNSGTALALVRLARLTKDDTYRARAEDVLRASADNMGRAPQAFLVMLHAFEDYLMLDLEPAAEWSRSEGKRKRSKRGTDASERR